MNVNDLVLGINVVGVGAVAFVAMAWLDARRELRDLRAARAEREEDRHSAGIHAYAEQPYIAPSPLLRPAWDMPTRELAVVDLLPVPRPAPPLPRRTLVRTWQPAARWMTWTDPAAVT